MTTPSIDPTADEKRLAELRESVKSYPHSLPDLAFVIGLLDASRARVKKVERALAAALRARQSRRQGRRWQT